MIKCKCGIQMSQMARTSKEQKTKIILGKMLFNTSANAAEPWHLKVQDTE